MTLTAATDTWVEVCGTDDIVADRGIAVLVDGLPIAIFRLSNAGPLAEEWFAVDHIDPRTGSPVIARGLIGSSSDGEPYVASPIHKQRYALATGRGLDDETALTCHDIRIDDGRIHVRSSSSP